MNNKIQRILINMEKTNLLKAFGKTSVDCKTVVQTVPTIRLRLG